MPDSVVEVKPRWRGVSHEIAAFVFPVLGVVLVAVAHTTAARVGGARVHRRRHRDVCRERVLPPRPLDPFRATPPPPARPLDDPGRHRRDLHPDRGRRTRHAQRPHPARHRVAACARRDRRADVLAATRHAGSSRVSTSSIGWTALAFIPGAVAPASASSRSRSSSAAASSIPSARGSTRRAGPIPCPRCSASMRCFTRS